MDDQPRTSTVLSVTTTTAGCLEDVVVPREFAARQPTRREWDSPCCVKQGTGLLCLQPAL